MQPVRAVVDPGFTPVNFDHPDQATLPHVFTDSWLLVVSDGHVVGTRERGSFDRGRVPVETPFGTMYLPVHQLSMLHGDAIHSALWIEDADVFGLQDSDDVPAPFDEFRVGGRRLSGKA